LHSCFVITAVSLICLVITSYHIVVSSSGFNRVSVAGLVNIFQRFCTDVCNPGPLCGVSGAVVNQIVRSIGGLAPGHGCLAVVVWLRAGLYGRRHGRDSDGLTFLIIRTPLPAVLVVCPDGIGIFFTTLEWMLPGRFMRILQIFAADSCQCGPLLCTGLFVINTVRSGILGLLPGDRCGILGRGNFRNRRSCGRSFRGRRGGGVKDCRGNQCDGQQNGNQTVPQPSFVWFLYHIFFHKDSPSLYFFLIYILQQIYMVCKKENNAPPRGGAFM